MSKYEDMRHATNWQNAIPMAKRREYCDFWHKQLELGFWAKLSLWLKGKL
jgi:hypothetical protein